MQNGWCELKILLCLCCIELCSFLFHFLVCLAFDFSFQSSAAHCNQHTQFACLTVDLTHFLTWLTQKRHTGIPSFQRLKDSLYCYCPSVEDVIRFFSPLPVVFFSVFALAFLIEPVFVFVSTERPKECVWWSHIGCIGAPRAQEETQMCTAMKGSSLFQSAHTHTFTHTLHRQRHTLNP